MNLIQKSNTGKTHDDSTHKKLLEQDKVLGGRTLRKKRLDKILRYGDIAL